MTRPTRHVCWVVIAGFGSVLLISSGGAGCGILPGDGADAGGSTPAGGSAGPRGGSEAGGSGGQAGATGAAGTPGTAGTTGAAGTPGPSGSGGAAGPTADPFATARQACVDKINALRATEGKPPYLRWTAAEECSDAEAKSDSISKKAHGAFGMCKESAQDECPGWPNDPNKIVTGCLQDMWNEGPGAFAEHGHYLNMSSTKYKSVACGFFVTPDKKMWAVQNFK